MDNVQNTWTHIEKSHQDSKYKQDALVTIEGHAWWENEQRIGFLVVRNRSWQNKAGQCASEWRLVLLKEHQQAVHRLDANMVATYVCTSEQNRNGKLGKEAHRKHHQMVQTWSCEHFSPSYVRIVYKEKSMKHQPIVQFAIPRSTQPISVDAEQPKPKPVGRCKTIKKRWKDWRTRHTERNNRPQPAGWEAQDSSPTSHLLLWNHFVSDYIFSAYPENSQRWFSLITS